MDIHSAAHKADNAVRAALEGGLRRFLLFLAVLMLLVGLSIAGARIANTALPFITIHYFLAQDFPVLLALLTALVIGGAWRGHPRLLLMVDSLLDVARSLRPWQLAMATVAICSAGVPLVFGGFPLSMDEFWARADGRILATGAGLVPVPAEWRDYALALQPIFTRLTPDGWWASEYLPVNALIQHLAGPFASPLLTGFSVLVTADLARRLLPQAPFAPILCAGLMISSSQILIIGMTPYAMSAHLAFNMAWLWLFLTKDWRAQLAAMPLAALAIGLHQVVFFPLFAAPFLIHGWFAHRRAAAMVQAVAIGAGFLFWSAYDQVLYAALDVLPVTRSGGGTGTGIALLFSRFIVLVQDFGLEDFGLMAFNLLRFVTWQNVLVAPLVLIAASGFARMPNIWRAMLGGIVLTTVAMTILLSFQGHGWGYRYLHGQLGSACLLATYACVSLPHDIRTSREARALFGAGLIVSLLLLPVRAWQAASFTAPYRLADAAISEFDADIVLVDAPQHIYAVDLIRNDPLLNNRPKRMTPLLLSDAQLADLCRRYKVTRFTDADAARFGLHKVMPTRTARALPVACYATKR